MFEGSIKGGFGRLGKATPGKLPRSEVVGNTFTADPFFCAWIIGAVAFFHIFFLIAFHSPDSFQIGSFNKWFFSGFYR
jgi:hypothetical protein